jgi:ParB-like chromosome segregation protein Spo0J
VPVHVADLPPEKAKAYRLADNATNEIASWDDELMPMELQDLQAVGVDISTLGFSQDALDNWLNGQRDGQVDPDAIPEPPDDAITQPGDIWILGDHRLMCGDNASPADLDRLLDGAAIHLVNTDPPYGVRLMYRFSA